MDILKVCPQLIVQNRTRTLYKGYISASNQDFLICVTLREPGILKGASIACEWKLQHLLRNYLTILQKRLQQSRSLAEFLVELKSIIERQVVKSNEVETAPPPPKFYQHLIEQIEMLGWEKLVYINDSFQELHLSAKDRNNRSHLLKIQLNSRHPDVGPECLADFPQAFSVAWTSTTTLQVWPYTVLHIVVSNRHFAVSFH